MDWLTWYNSLAKPSWTPSPATIGLIWQVLYPIILISFGFVFVQAIRRRVPWPVTAPFAISRLNTVMAEVLATPESLAEAKAAISASPNNGSDCSTSRTRRHR